MPSREAFIHLKAPGHTLIKQGAKLVEHAQDIMEELSYIIEAPHEKHKTGNEIMERTSQLSPEESLVFEAIGAYLLHIDDLARKLSIKPGKLSSILLQLELKGIVHQSPGKFFSVVSME